MTDNVLKVNQVSSSIVTSSEEVGGVPPAARKPLPFLSSLGGGGGMKKLKHVNRESESDTKSVSNSKDAADSCQIFESPEKRTASSAINMAVTAGTARATAAWAENNRRKIAWENFEFAMESQVKMSLPFSDFSFIDLLGRGKFASVYSAVKGDGSRVALKIARYFGQEQHLLITPAATSSTASTIIDLNQPNSSSIKSSRPHPSYLPTAATFGCSKVAGTVGSNNSTPRTVTLIAADARMEGTENAQWKRAPVACIAEFSREIDALRELTGHKNLVQLHGYVLQPLSIVLSHCAGGNMHDCVRNMAWQVCGYCLIFVFDFFL